MEPQRCDACRRRASELHFSEAAGAVVCERCHCQATPPTPPVPTWKLTPRRRPKPDAYAQLVWAAWDRLAERGEVFYITPGWIVGRCPVCETGTLSVRFVKGEPPWLRLPDACSDGCSANLLAAVLLP